MLLNPNKGDENMKIQYLVREHSRLTRIASAYKAMGNEKAEAKVRLHAKFVLESIFKFYNANLRRG